MKKEDKKREYELIEASVVSCSSRKNKIKNVRGFLIKVFRE